MAGSSMSKAKRIRKFILFFFLGAIALPIVLLLLIILFVLCLGRVKYNVDAQVGDENSARVEIKYFMRLIKLAILYEGGETKVRGRVAWVRIGDDKPKKKKRRRRKKNRKKPQAKKSEATPLCANEQPHHDGFAHDTKNKDDAPKGKSEEISGKNIGSETFAEISSVKSIPEAPISKSLSPDAEPSMPATEEEKPPSFIEKAKQVRATLTEIDVKTIIGLVFQCLYKFIKAIKPKRLDISGIVGFDDPAATGWFMGAYEAAAGVTRLRPHIRLLGSYHEKALRLDIQAHGRFRLGRLFTPFIWLYLKKPIRTLIHKHLLRKGEK